MGCAPGCLIRCPPGDRVPLLLYLQQGLQRPPRHSQPASARLCCLPGRALDLRPITGASMAPGDAACTYRLHDGASDPVSLGADGRAPKKGSYAAAILPTPSHIL
ncbi:hypothetical protein NDU88_005580 [Pleurodeles waltl]|uniref:Uncharacterized protein n=1 Tax=Pleurodeles waltl TaxID=8319 RepID=A0AAV7WC77_PLEWA|nr:hypothetical protein NDU88_005580 [Pleurodeles waltl]